MRRIARTHPVTFAWIVGGLSVTGVAAGIAALLTSLAL